MFLYSFYPQTPGGLSLVFETYELSSDDAARAKAVAVLEAHPSASEIVIWCGGRMVSPEARRPFQRHNSWNPEAASAAR